MQRLNNDVINKRQLEKLIQAGTFDSIEKNRSRLFNNVPKFIELFGNDNNKGIRVIPSMMALEVVNIGENGITEDEILVHDETNKVVAQLLAGMKSPAFPTAIGVLYCEESTTYETAIHEQLTAEIQNKSNADLNELLRQGSTWTVT